MVAVVVVLLHCRLLCVVVVVVDKRARSPYSDDMVISQLEAWFSCPRKLARSCSTCTTYNHRGNLNVEKLADFVIENTKCFVLR